MTKDPRVYLAHIVECAGKIRRYIAPGEEAFQRDSMIQDAVIRNGHPEIPWRLMAGFRDVLIHGYDGVDLARVWVAAYRDLPAVEQALSGTLPPLDHLERELAGEDPQEQS